MKNFTRSLIAAAAFAVSSLAIAGPVNVNTADAKTIAEELKGIGQVKAERIVAYRETNGRIESAEELVAIKGVGKKSLEANREFILVD